MANRGWCSLFPQVSEGLRSLAITNIEAHSLCSCRLHTLETLEIKGSHVLEYIDSLNFPKLSMLVCTVSNQQYTFDCVFENLVSQFTASLQTFMLCSSTPFSFTENAFSEPLSPSVVWFFFIAASYATSFMTAGFPSQLRIGRFSARSIMSLIGYLFPG